MTLLAFVLVLASTFRIERTVTPGAAGPNRLDVDVNMLASAQADLRDLRLFDASGREVGYLLVPPKSDARWIDGHLLPIKSTKTTSGFELDLGSSVDVDRVKLDGIAAPFLKRVTLEGSGDRAHWTLLADATVFDLPDEELKRKEIAFDAGAYRYLRVMWDDRASARVTGTIDAQAREHASGAAPEGLFFDLQYLKRASEPRRSRYRMSLPGPHLPIASIEVGVAHGDVFRPATVTEPRLGNGEVTPVQLGSGTLKRAEREGAIASQMEVLISAPQGRELALVIDDGNNPPLEVAYIRAHFAPQPWIYFESRDGAPLTARYGNESATAPSYDVEASRPYVRTRKTASAKLSESPNLRSGTEPPKMTAPLGGPLDREQFRISRRIQAGPVGLSVLPLDADVLAHSPGLADVRIVDEQGRQVPYLVEQRAEPLPVKLRIPPRRAEGASSVYRVDLPYDNWPAGTRLVLTTSERVFERNVLLRRVHDTHRNREAAVIASSPWRSADPDSLPPPLSFDASFSGTSDIDLVIDEGDNAPLPIESAQLILPSSALRFYHPGTTLFLLYGNRRASAPRYDLALLAPRLFSEPARELSIAAAQKEAPEDEGPGRKIFWVGIAIAAVVLIVMLVRLLAPLRGEEPRSLG